MLAGLMCLAVTAVCAHEFHEPAGPVGTSHLVATPAPDRAGGVATYPQEAFGRRAPWLAALSGWGYWFAWTPGIAVNLILAAQYLHDTVAPGTNPMVLSAAIGIALYALNALGL